MEEEEIKRMLRLILTILSCIAILFVLVLIGFVVYLFWR